MGRALFVGGASNYSIFDCYIVANTTDRIISSFCDFSNVTGVSGFQMIVQNNELDKAHKLHINQTTNDSQLATVQVEEDGLYRVTIFPIIYGDTGILDGGFQIETGGLFLVAYHTDCGKCQCPLVLTRLLLLLMSLPLVIAACRCHLLLLCC